jgi:hypothetical protein
MDGLVRDRPDIAEVAAEVLGRASRPGDVNGSGQDRTTSVFVPTPENTLSSVDP